MKKRIFYFTMMFFFISQAQANDLQIGLTMETPERADEVLGSSFYINKELSVFIDDFPYTKNRILPALSKEIEKRKKNGSPEDVLGYTISYLSAEPRGQVEASEVCIHFVMLVPGFRKVSMIFLCVIQAQNTINDFLINKAPMRAVLLKALLRLRQLNENDKNEHLLLKEHVKYFSNEPPPESVSLNTSCTQFDIPAMDGSGKKTFYICLE